MIISIGAKKAFDKNPAPIYDKNIQQSGNRRSIPQHHQGQIQETYCQHRTQWAKTKSFALKIRNKTRVSALTILIQHSTVNSRHNDQTRKINKRYPNWEEEVELSLSADGMIVYKKIL